jgi:hypothetical protein
MSQPSNDTKSDAKAGPQRLQGGCHCGAVRFEAELDLSQGGSRCNCTVCTKTATLGAIVKPHQLSLLKGEDDLGAYAWGAKISTRYFCRHCGVHCFGRGHLAEVGGDYASVNLNCLDDVDPWIIKTIYWDGRHNNWYEGPRPTPWPVTQA